MIQEISIDHLRTCLVGDDPLLVVVAPNFEERSRGLVDAVLSERVRLLTEGISPRPIVWLILVFQGSNPNFLDGVKGNIARGVVADLRSEGFLAEARLRVLPYPISGQRLISEVNEELRELGPASSSIIDFSAIPRNVLYRLIGSISQGRFEPYIRKDERPILAYCWAKRYPEVRSLELIGEVRGQSSQLPLSEFVKDADYCELTVLAAGSVHDAYSALTAVTPLARSAEVNITTIFFMNPSNLEESWRQLRNHHGLLREASQSGQIEYCYGTDHFLGLVERRLDRAILQARKGREVAFAAAHFGPKPMVVGTQLLLEQLGDAPAFRADMFNSMGTQYLSVYSLGVGGISLYALGGK